MKVAGMVQDSIVDGPGLRFTLFTQGCPHNCPGCHNPETHDPAGGTEVPVDEVIREMLRNPLTDGLTLSGGDPFAQPGPCAEVARAAHKAGLNVWTYTGYTFEALLEKAAADPQTADLLYETDVLVDGPFILAQKSLAVKWRGSKNQRLLSMKESLEAGKAVDLDR